MDFDPQQPKSPPTQTSNPTVIHKAVPKPIKKTNNGCLGQLSSKLAEYYAKLAAQQTKKAQQQHDQQVALRDGLLDWCADFAFPVNTLKYQGNFYAEMKQQAAWIQSLADQYEAAGDLATAEKLRNNPLQQAIDVMPEFEYIAANPPYAKSNMPVPGEDLPVPNAPLQLPSLPGEEESGSSAPATPIATEAPLPVWDILGDPIRNGWAASTKLICKELAYAEIPEPKVTPKLPAAAFIGIAILILVTCGFFTAVGAVIGTQTFSIPNTTKHVEQNLGIVEDTGIEPSSDSTFTPVPNADSTVTDTPTPTSTAVGQPVLPQGPTVTPVGTLCADRGGTAYYGEVCICPGIIDQVTICGDGTKFDNPTTTACTPTETCTNTGNPAEPQPPVCACGQYGAPSQYDMGCSDGTISLCVIACGCKP